MRDLVILHPCQDLVLPGCCFPILTGVVVAQCGINLHFLNGTFLMCLFAFYISLVKGLFTALPIFKNCFLVEF